jgi:chromosome condensin MukBEF MukE localization factor
VKGNLIKRQKFEEKLEDLRFERKGGMIIRASENSQKFKIAFLPGARDL